MNLGTIAVRLIGRDGVQCGDPVNILNLNRKPGTPYEPRVMGWMGRRFMEPTAEILDVCPVTDWHEVEPSK
jgi:hypothetical protein